MPTVKNVCVFCGSNHGYNPNFLKETNALGQYLADNHFLILQSQIDLIGLLHMIV